MAAHHLLLSHGLAARVIRANVSRPEIGIALNLVPVEPASPSEADRRACRIADGRANRWFLDPLYGRGYPADVVAYLGRTSGKPDPTRAFVRAGDLETIAEPTDFLGINYYTRGIVGSDAGSGERNEPRAVHSGGPTTAMGWEVYPAGLERILCRIHSEYAPAAIYVTENGAAYEDPALDTEGMIRDSARRNYLEEHLRALLVARSAGVPLKGYFVWSLIDNFEWAEGYTKRFGLVSVDYRSQERTLKQSAYWYRRVAASGRLTP
jgi:beta-glucosidase